MCKKLMHENKGKKFYGTTALKKRALNKALSG
jgi:hypothetical protein